MRNIEKRGSLLIQRADFLGALRTLQTVVGRSKHNAAVLTFRAGELTIDCEGQSTAIDATGEWEARTELPFLLLMKLRRGVPREDQFLLELTEDSVAIGKFRVSALSPEDMEQQAHERERQAQEELSRALTDAARILAPLKVGVSDLKRLVEAKRGAAGKGTVPLRLVKDPYGSPWGKLPAKAATRLARWGVTEVDLEDLIRRSVRRWMD